MKGKAVILASGSGTRLGGKKYPKHLTKLNGVEILIWLLKNLFSSFLFDEIFVVCRKFDLQLTKEVVEKYYPNENPLKINFLEGGEKRIDSISAGIQAIIDNKEIDKKQIISLFDANRPFIDKTQINELFELTTKFSCACPARGIINGIAEINNQAIIKVPRKDKFVEFFTPEFITLECLLKDYSQLKNFKSLVEYCLKIGIKPRFTEASIFNSKLTYPEDISFFENIINQNNISKPEKII